MIHETTSIDWRMVASCLASQNYTSILKGLVHHFTAIEDEEILDKIYEDFMNNDCITRYLIMIYRQLLTIIYQNENYILIKLEHPSLYGEGCSC
uniref:Uncharacterized protein n=1 Tax=Staphylococcus aureus TaxID=1280 RepID=R4X2S6_STAAU|nr:hypothetical protein [Staphylococcus aureus]